MIYHARVLCDDFSAPIVDEFRDDVPFVFPSSAIATVQPQMIDTTVFDNMSLPIKNGPPICTATITTASSCATTPGKPIIHNKPVIKGQGQQQLITTGECCLSNKNLGKNNQSSSSHCVGTTGGSYSDNRTNDNNNNDDEVRIEPNYRSSDLLLRTLKLERLRNKEKLRLLKKSRIPLLHGCKEEQNTSSSSSSSLSHQYTQPIEASKNNVSCFPSTHQKYLLQLCSSAAHDGDHHYGNNNNNKPWRNERNFTKLCEQYRHHRTSGSGGGGVPPRYIIDMDVDDSEVRAGVQQQQQDVVEYNVVLDGEEQDCIQLLQEETTTTTTATTTDHTSYVPPQPNGGWRKLNNDLKEILSTASNTLLIASSQMEILKVLDSTKSTDNQGGVGGVTMVLPEVMDSSMEVYHDPETMNLSLVTDSSDDSRTDHTSPVQQNNPIQSSHVVSISSENVYPSETNNLLLQQEQNERVHIEIAPDDTAMWDQMVHLCQNDKNVTLIVEFKAGIHGLLIQSTKVRMGE